MGDIANANNMAVADILVAGRTITIPVPEDAATTPPETPVTPAIPETTMPGFGTDSLGTRPGRLVVPPEPSPVDARARTGDTVHAFPISAGSSENERRFCSLRGK